MARTTEQFEEGAQIGAERPAQKVLASRREKSGAASISTKSTPLTQQPAIQAAAPRSVKQDQAKAPAVQRSLLPIPPTMYQAVAKEQHFSPPFERRSWQSLEELRKMPISHCHSCTVAEQQSLLHGLMLKPQAEQTSAAAKVNIIHNMYKDKTVLKFA